MEVEGIQVRCAPNMVMSPTLPTVIHQEGPVDMPLLFPPDPLHLISRHPVTGNIGNSKASDQVSGLTCFLCLRDTEENTIAYKHYALYLPNNNWV